MKTGTLAKLSPFLAAFVAWMLSGSPVPMAFSALLLGAFLIAGKLARSETSRFYLRFLSPFLILAAVSFQIYLFQNGLSYAVSADLPLFFHIAMGILWATAAESSLAENQHESFHLHSGLLGSLLFLCSSFTVVLYDFSAWQVYPIAALPLSLFVLKALAPGIRKRSFAIGSIALSLGLVALGLTLSRGTEQAAEWVRGKDSRLDELASSNRPQFDDGTGGPDGSSRRLPRKANIKFDDRIRIYLKAESPELFRSWIREPLYLRTSTVSVFESDEVIAPVRSGRWIYDSDDGETDQSIPLSQTLPDQVHDYTLFIESEAAHALPLLTGTTTVATSALYEFADDWFQLAPHKGIRRLLYRSRMPLPSNPTPEYISLSDFRQQDGPGVYLNLPPSPLAARVTRLCDSFPENSSIEEIREHLQSRATYSLDYETPVNMSPVENLLFGERKGHCELYAAASVMMLRSVGIPSRLAYGYSGGIADKTQRLIAFRDRDFHAWAEVLTPDNKWIIYDSTPVSNAAATRTPSLTQLAAADWDSYENFSEGVDASAVGSFGLLNTMIGLISFLSEHFLPLTWLGVLLALVITWIRNARGRKRKQEQDSPIGMQESTLADGLMRELEGCGKQLGISKSTGTTWLEYHDQMMRDTRLPAFFLECISYYYRIRYAGKELDHSKEQALQDQLKNWKRERLTD